MVLFAPASRALLAATCSALDQCILGEPSRDTAFSFLRTSGLKDRGDADPTRRKKVAEEGGLQSRDKEGGLHSRDTVVLLTFLTPLSGNCHWPQVDLAHAPSRFRCADGGGLPSGGVGMQRDWVEDRLECSTLREVRLPCLIGPVWRNVTGGSL
jgi:hypothetical protein